MKPVKLVILLILSFVFTKGVSQDITVNKEQDFNFGSFYSSNSSGGSVSVSNTGNWSSTGNIFQVGSTHQPAVFTVTCTCTTSSIIVEVNRPTGILTNGNGESIDLQTGIAEPEFTRLSLTSSSAQITIGATLTIGEQAISSLGEYNGTVLLTFTSYYE